MPELEIPGNIFIKKATDDGMLDLHDHVRFRQHGLNRPLRLIPVLTDDPKHIVHQTPVSKFIPAPRVCLLSNIGLQQSTAWIRARALHEDVVLDVLADTLLELFWKWPAHGRCFIPILDHVDAQGSSTQDRMNCVSEQFEVTAHEKLCTKDAHFCVVRMESCGGTYLVLVVLRILLTVPV